jgi:TRAP transporter TAXI family solute receptor
MGRPYSKTYIPYLAPAVIVTLFGFLVAYQFVSPAPPRHLTIATGQSNGTYYDIGRKYSAILARDNVTLSVKETSGAVENLRLIADKNSGVDVIFMQGGVAGTGPYEDLVSLGSLYYEPLWVFSRSQLPITFLHDMRGLRISVGLEESGTRALATQLLALNDVNADNSQILMLSGDEAARRLLDGEIDAAFYVIGNLEVISRDLLRSQKVKLLSFERGEAYTRRLHFLSYMKLPQGAIDLASDIPGEDIYMILPTAQLIAHKNLHPALIELLLQAAGEVSSGGGLFEKPGEFPSPQYTDFPLSSDAKRFYISGPTFLRRYLPFWLANFLIRMKVMLLPLLALLFPLVKLFPPFYQWRVRSRIFRWYDKILEIDFQMLDGDITDRKQEFKSRLDWIEREVSRISVPRGYNRELYDMRVHIEMLRGKMIEGDGKQVCKPANGAMRKPETGS